MGGKLTIAFALVIAALTGCKESTPSVSGDVTYNGAPVESGYISFSPVEKGRSFAAPIVNGRYVVEKAFSGNYKAIARGTRKINHYASSAEANANAGKFDSEGLDAADYIAANAEGNGKQVDITSGDQQLDLAITGPPMPK